VKKKLNSSQILTKAGHKYKLLKDAKYGLDYNISPEIRSDQVRAIVEVLVEEINKILD